MARHIAEDLAKKQKEISVSEFFERNKHILGFDSGTRALLTAVKEAVDNALDACEEASILPEIRVEVNRVSGGGGLKDAEYELVVEDNGPGIVKRQMGNIFARLLYGSRFHAIRQSRGQQGIGISAAVMYGQLTTGKPAVVQSKIGDGEPVNVVHLKLDTRNNKPDFVKQSVTSWEKPHGTHVSIHLIGKYMRGQTSVYEYLRGTAIVNPHAKITLKEPDGTVTLFDRATELIPEPTTEIKPHPHGIELGQLLKIAKDTGHPSLTALIQSEFSRVSTSKAKEVFEKMGEILGKDGETLSRMRPTRIDVPEGRALLDAFNDTKLMAPPTDCLSPIGEVLVKKGLKKELPDTEFIATVTRPPNVYSGRPFQVEVGLAYGGGLPKDDTCRVIRFANRVPLLYQKGACVSTAAVESVDWRRYELDQRGGRGMPTGPAVMLVHVASVNVPFTSEAKEAIADIEDIQNEIKLALQECGRKLGSHVRKRAKLAKMKEKEAVIRKILPKIAEKSAQILDRPIPDIEPVIARIMNNVMLNDTIEYDEATRTHHVSVAVTNYTTTLKSFDLVSALPHGVTVSSVSPDPVETGDGFIRWRIRKLESAKIQPVEWKLHDLDLVDYDETDLYVKGVDPAIVIGAEEWKGLDGGDAEVIERITVLEHAPEDGGGDGDVEEISLDEADAMALDLDDAENKGNGSGDDDDFGDLVATDARPKGRARAAAPGKGGATKGASTTATSAGTAGAAPAKGKKAAGKKAASKPRAKAAKRKGGDA